MNEVVNNRVSDLMPYMADLMSFTENRHCSIGNFLMSDEYLKLEKTRRAIE